MTEQPSLRQFLDELSNYSDTDEASAGSGQATVPPIGRVLEIAGSGSRVSMDGVWRTRIEFTVIGDAVNLAAKLEKHNKRERTRALATRVAYDMARAQGYGKDKPVREARDVAGVNAPIDLAVLA